MIRKRLFLWLLTLMVIVTASAQEALWSGSQVQSPVVNNDGTVTFNVSIPGATKVEVTGDFLPAVKIDTPMGPQERPGTTALTQNGNVWTYTTAPLAPELYSYSLIVNGMSMLDPSNVYVNRDVASLTSIFIVSREAGDKGQLYQVNEVPHGDVAKVWYDSPTLKMKRRMTIYTPAGYDKGGDYPVLYLLHGAGGDEDAWTTLGRAAQILDNMIASGRAVPMIVVMPNGNTDCQAAPGAWSRGMYQPSFLASVNQKPIATMDESFPDIIAYVESHYRVKADKQHRAICGLSMGGWHSYATSRRYPQLFDYVGLFSAALSMSDDRNMSYYDLAKKDTKIQQQLAALFAAKPKLYWIGIGKTDFLYDQNTGLRRYLTEMGYPYEYVETEGGHIWRNWRDYLTIFAGKIFK
ncbi:MAG: esterase [Prevotella sp.]|nr:esterase [Prevotella sp.]